jgi:uncharacterized Tic20 family protein
MAIYALAGSVLLAITIIGIYLIPFYLIALYLLNILGVVLASIRASEGRNFRFWLILRLVR